MVVARSAQPRADEGPRPIGARAWALADDTEDGLSGSIWTRDVGRALRVARAVDSGNLSVHSHASVPYSTPFGGFTASGLGRELGPDAPAAFTEVKNVVIATDRAGPGPTCVPRARSADPSVNRYTHRVALVTGGASGIGAATVRRLAEEGAHVVVVDVDADAGRTLAKEVGGDFVAADVTSADDNARMYAETVDRHQRIDFAFHNAGISPPEDASVIDTPLEVWRRVQEVNLTSVYLGCQAVLPYMLAQGRGAIVNTASFVASMGAATSQVSYTASKGGVLAMTREFGVQFARQGVRVNALSPGPVATPLLMELFASDPERAQRRLVHVPMGRFATPEEIAAAVAFLGSDDASFITASNFLVDGGITGAYVTPL